VRGAVVALLVVLLGGVVGLQALHERRGGRPASTSASMLYVRSPEAMNRLALSYDALLADTYWIRAVQHFGSTRRSAEPNNRYDLLYPLLDLTTSLDPRFDVPYKFGAIFLSEAPPGGPGRPDLAIALLEKGLKAQPEKWEFAQAIGFVHYWSREDYPEAAAWFARAAEFPGAPDWMAPLAATTLAVGGRRDSSRQLWQQVAESEDAGDWFRREAARRLQQLDAMDQIDELQRVADAYAQRAGRQASGWDELRRAGYLRGTPADPTGAPYTLESGVVNLDRQSRLSPLPAAGVQVVAPR
jgi:tetratricopeptide (TPR) repeat protein